MQMRFDGLLGFPGGFVNPSEESLEEGLSRELLEEIGAVVPITVENHVESCYSPAPASSPRLILHFYAKKMEEEQILEIERSAATTAIDHGHEVLGMVRVPLYRIKGGGLSTFLSHSFIGTARQQLLDCLLRFDLVAPHILYQALRTSVTSNTRNAKELKASMIIVKEKQQSNPAAHGEQEQAQDED